MLFFAWSFIQTAVNYARRQRLITILQKHLFAPFSYETGLICRRISKKNIFSGPSTSSSSSSAFGPSTSNSFLVKAPSEPFLNYETSDTVILYRTEELEIVAIPKPDSLKIHEWTLFTTDNIPRKSIFIPPNVPRVSFIAVIIPSPNFISNQTGTIISSTETSSMEEELTTENNKNGENNEKMLKIDASGMFFLKKKFKNNNDKMFLVENLVDNEQNDTGFLSLLNSYANQIAFCRRKPNEILYETDLNNFYNIIFQWSESALYEFGGKGIVKEIHSVQLPNLCSDRALLPSSPSNSTFSQISSNTLPATFSNYKHRQQPYTLLEYLYLKDLFGDEFPASWRTINIENNFYFNNSLKNGYSFYRSDSALNRAISPIGSFYRTRRALPPSGESSFTNLNAQLPPLPQPRSPSPIPSPPIPAYIRQLREHEKFDRRRTVSLNSSKISSSNAEKNSCSPNETFDDLLEDIKYIDQSSIDDNFSLKSLNTIIPSTSADTSRNNSVKIEKEFKNFVTAENHKVSSETKFNPPPSVPAPQYYPIPKHHPINNYHTFNSSNLFRRQFSNLSGKRLTKIMTEKITKRIRMGVSSFGKELKPVENNNGGGCGGGRKRFASLIPSDIDKEMETKFYSRRRSLSPLTLSIIESHAESTTLTNTSAIGAQSRLSANEQFVRRRSVTPTRRRFHSIPNRRAYGISQLDSSFVEEETYESKPPQKPPTILVYTGNNPELYKRIFNSIQCIIPENTYTIFHLSSKALISEPWIDENAICVLLGDTNSLDDKAWSKLQTYFIHSGKIFFLCQNSLLASLNTKSGGSIKKQANLLKNAFGNKNISISLGKEFESFLKKSMKILNKNKEVNETFHAKDLIGKMSYSVVIHKKQDQPLLLYMENSANNASALFSDATADELIATGGISLIADAMKRLKIQVVDSQEIPSLSQGYFICEPDKLAWEMSGLAYEEEIGMIPKLFFFTTKQPSPAPKTTTSTFLPIQVCQRKAGLPASAGFDVEKYYKSLKTKTLGKAMLYIPICETTMSISKSLFHALPSFDGILVVAGAQTKGFGRSGNQWLSPKGCAMFTFNFNIPLLSNLGQSATFIQHILAVSIVDAVITILGISDFALKIKWPNDLYYNRLFKMGGILVNSSISGETLHCVIGAGINVCNSKPTVCLNDMIPEGCDKVLSVEEVIAETMNKFEHYVNLFEKNGKQAFLRRYYDFWLHTREEINIQNANANDTKERVVIRGLDSHGFLEVRSKQNGKVFSVHDNGNTFDMMKGLIRPKNRP